MGFYIANQNGTSIVAVQSVLLQGTIIYVNDVIFGKYDDERRAQMVVDQIFVAIQDEKRIYAMPVRGAASLPERTIDTNETTPGVQRFFR